MGNMLQTVQTAFGKIKAWSFFQKRVTISHRVLLVASFGYICVPLVLFAFGWMKAWIALLFSLACIIGCIGMIQNFSKEAEGVSIGVFALCLLAVLLFIYGAIVGWGGTSRKLAIGQNTTPSCATS